MPTEYPWLMCGDCLEKMKEIPDASVDMVLCDLPYGTTACKWDVVISLDLLWEQYWRTCKSNAAVVLFCGQPFTSALITSQIKYFKYNWTWEKTTPTNFLNSKKEPLRLTEDIAVFYKSLPVYNPQKITGKPYKGKWSSETEITNDFQDWRSQGYFMYDGDRMPVNILTVPVDRKLKLHPTQKPTSLLEYLVKTYTNEGQIILDNTMGSGSTGVACVNTERKFIGIEKDEKYFSIAEKRIAEALAKKAENLFQED